MYQSIILLEQLLLFSLLRFVFFAFQVLPLRMLPLRTRHYMYPQSHCSSITPSMGYTILSLLGGPVNHPKSDFSVKRDANTGSLRIGGFIRVAHLSLGSRH